MLLTDAKRRTNMDYDRKNTKLIGMKLNKNTDADILAHLGKQENIQGYLKRLIREDMKRGERTMKTYKIKPEYLDFWEGGDTPSDPDRIITECELKELAQEWDKPVDELLDQLIPQK